MRWNTVGLFYLRCITSSHILLAVSVLEPYIHICRSADIGWHTCQFFPAYFKKTLCIFHFQEQLFASCSALQDALAGKLCADFESCLVVTNKYNQLRGVWDVFTSVHCECVTIIWLPRLIVPKGTDSSHWNVGNYQSTLRNIPEDGRSRIGWFCLHFKFLKYIFFPSIGTSWDRGADVLQH
jgi:hypothetical protein